MAMGIDGTKSPVKSPLNPFFVLPKQKMRITTDFSSTIFQFEYFLERSEFSLLQTLSNDPSYKETMTDEDSSS